MYYFWSNFQVSPASLGEPRQISSKVRENKKRWLGCEPRNFWLLSIIFAHFTAELQWLPKTGWTYLKNLPEILHKT
jgi:hypothetical protein